MRTWSIATLILACCALPAMAEEWPVGSPPIRVAVGPVCPPLFDIGFDGKARGFVVDYLTEAAQRAQVPIEFELVSDRRAFAAMDPAEYPLALWLLADEPFPGYVRFERGFLTLHSVVFRRIEPHVKTELEAADLGEVIAVRGSEAHQDLLDDGAVDIVTVPTVADGVLLLSSGKHDTLFATDVFVLQAIRDLGVKNVEVAPSSEMHMHHRFALMRAVTRPDVEELLSPGLRAMRHDGTFDRLYTKWFGAFEEKEIPLHVFGLTITLIVLAAILLGLVIVPLSRRRLRALLNWQGQALEETEARIAAIMAASPTGIFRLDLNGAVTFGNQEAGRITGIKERPVDLKRWLSAIHPDDRTGVTDAWKAVRDHNVADHREYRFMHPDGEVVWVLDRGHPELDSTGNIIGFVGTLTDITQLKHHEASYRTHSKVLMSMTEGVNTTDVNGKILYTNAAFDAMFGYATGELIGQNVSALNHVSQREYDRHSDTIKHALLTRGHWAGEFRNRRKDGTEFWTRARISRLEGAGEAFGVCVQEDITEAKRAQEAIRESEEKFRSVAESAIVGIALYDGDRFVFANDAMMQLVGYTPPELYGMDREQMIRLFCPTQDISQIVAALGVLDSYGEYHGPLVLGDMQYYRKNGEERWAWVSIARLYPDRPFPRMFMCVDTTERHLAQEAMRESEEKFRRVADSALVGIAIHDETRYTYFNSAMQRLLGYTPEDFEGLDADEEARKVIPEFEIPRVMESFARMDSAGFMETDAIEDVCLMHKDGTPRWATLFFSRLFPDRPYPRLTVTVDTTTRVRAREALRESEEKFRSVAESAMVGLAIFDGETYPFVNRAMLQLYGYEIGEIASFARADLAQLFFDGSEQSRVIQALQQLDQQMDSTEPVVLEDVCVRHKNGEPRWAYIMFSRLYPDRLFPRLTVCVDTTQRKLAEQSVAKHQDMLRRTQQMARIGGWEYTLGANTIECSDVVHQIYGLQPTAIVTWETLLSRFRPEDQEMIRTHGLRAVAEIIPFNHEGEITNMRGEHVWVHMSAEPVVEDGRVIRIVGAVQDISDLKRVENSLRESEALFRAFSEQMPDALLLLDLDDEEVPGRILYANAAAACMHGMTHDEIVGISIGNLDAPDTAKHIDGRLARLRNGETIYFEGEHVRKDGSIFPVDVVARRIDALGGNKILAIDRDITERRKVETERRKMDEQMQQSQRLESLAVLAGGIAHDFNNLLAGILGHADLAREDVPAGTPARESVEQIDLAARRAADLVHQMLAYAGRGNFVIRQVHLSAMVREMAKLLEVTLSKKAVLKFELDDTAPAIEADSVQLQQVVMNLITNASDALDDNAGTITLRSGAVDYCEDALRAYAPHEPAQPGRFVFLEVTDTGCGMDATTLNRIFDPFFTTKFTGRGLGLAATLGIIRGHGGGLRVTSRVGGGTTFRIIFPVAVQADRVVATPQANGGLPEPVSNGHASTLLVVDDEPRVRDFLVRALQRFGHEVFSAADGQQALDLFARNSERIDAVLLDITMPGIGGEEVLHQLHAQSPDLPVLLMSGFSEAETKQRLRHNGFTGFLQKPFSIDALRQAVDALFVRK